MIAGIRTPAEVISLVLEERGLSMPLDVAEECAARLAVAMKSVSRPGARVVCQAVAGRLEWATVHTGVKTRTRNPHE